MSARDDRLARRYQRIRKEQTRLVTDALLAAARLRESPADTAERIVSALYEFVDEQTQPTYQSERELNEPSDLDSLLVVVRESLGVLRSHGIDPDLIDNRAANLVMALEFKFLIEERPRGDA